MFRTRIIRNLWESMRWKESFGHRKTSLKMGMSLDATDRDKMLNWFSRTLMSGARRKAKNGAHDATTFYLTRTPVRSAPNFSSVSLRSINRFNL